MINCNKTIPHQKIYFISISRHKYKKRKRKKYILIDFRRKKVYQRQLTRGDKINHFHFLSYV